MLISRALVASSLLAVSVFAQTGWPQWGGPSRDFQAADTKIADKWPETGPKVIWKRELGPGYSSIIVGDGVLYTMYRDDENEAVVALDAASGATKWKHDYPAPVGEKFEASFGKGPNATPLLVGERLITAGVNGVLNCLDAKSGKVQWAVNLATEYDATFLQFGYSASPVLHKDTVIVPIGSKSGSVAALGLADGKPKWTAATFDNSYSSPILVKVGKRTVATLVMPKQIIGIDADDGTMLFEHEYKNQWDCHCTTPVDCGDGRVFYPSFGAGILLQLTAAGDKVEAKELWNTKVLGAGQTDVLRIGEHLYGASGSGKAGFFACISLKTGEQAWRERLPMAMAVGLGKRMLLLAEDGELRLVNVSPEKLDTVSQVTLLEPKAWTPPTVVDGRAYLRDQKQVMALDLR
ncbi:MAG: PQQ-binding-like beta-propeller repeat protein [Phycisphaerae bacterium]